MGRLIFAVAGLLIGVGATIALMVVGHHWVVANLAGAGTACAVSLLGVTLLRE